MAKGTDGSRRRRPGSAGLRAVRRWGRSNIGVALVLVVMAAVEVFGLRAGTLGIVALAAVGVVAVVLVVTRFSMVNIALGTVYAAAVTLTWNGWFVGPARPGDILAILAVVAFVAAHSGGRLPRLPIWVWQLVGGIVLVAALNIAFPPDPVYVASRIVLRINGAPPPYEGHSITSANLSVAFKFLVAAVLVPLAFAFAVTYGRHILRRLVVLFALGAALSGWTAILGLYGINTLNRLTGLVAPGAPRQIGLSNQPNYLAAAVVLALPIGIWLLVEKDTRSRWLGLFIAGGCVLGVYATGSRGGAACTVFAVAVSIILIPNARKYVAGSFLVAITAANGIYLLVPSLGESILKATRLVGASAATDPSDQARVIVAKQALQDFDRSPIHGIGLQVSFDAQTVYLQELQSGGLILAISMLVYNLGAVITSFRLIKVNSLAAALCASVLCSLALDVFEANISDRYYYVPIAGVVALLCLPPEPAPVARTPIERRPPAPPPRPLRPMGVSP